MVALTRGPGSDADNFSGYKEHARRHFAGLFFAVLLLALTCT